MNCNNICFSDFNLTYRLAMIIALSVTTVCVIWTIIIIVCCFWSRCPLYTACRIRYHQDDIIAYGRHRDCYSIYFGFGFLRYIVILLVINSLVSAYQCSLFNITPCIYYSLLLIMTAVNISSSNYYLVY